MDYQELFEVCFQLVVCLQVSTAEPPASAAPPPVVWLLTLGTQSLANDAASATHGGSWGLARSARIEAQLPLLCVDALSSSSLELGTAIPEPEVVMRVGSWSGSRLVTASPRYDGALQLNTAVGGQTHKIFTEAQSVLSPLEPLEVELHVRAVALSYADVLRVLSGRAEDTSLLRTEAAGVIAQSEISYGLEGASFGLACAAFASIAHTPVQLLVSKPTVLSFDEASSLPMAWCLAHLALRHATLRCGERCVVQAAAGSIGLKTVKPA